MLGTSRWRWYEPCGPGCGVTGEHRNVPEFVLPWTWEKKSTADTRATQTRIVIAISIGRVISVRLKKVF